MKPQIGDSKIQHRPSIVNGGGLGLGAVCPCGWETTEWYADPAAVNEAINNHIADVQ